MTKRQKIEALEKLLKETCKCAGISNPMCGCHIITKAMMDLMFGNDK
jgi:hypothetical protein